MSIPSGGAGNAPIKYTTEDELRIDTVWALKAVALAHVLPASPRATCRAGRNSSIVGRGCRQRRPSVRLKPFPLEKGGEPDPRVDTGDDREADGLRDEREREG